MDDLDGALRVMDTFQTPPLSPRQMTRLSLALVRACGLTPARQGFQTGMASIYQVPGAPAGPRPEA